MGLGIRETMWIGAHKLDLNVFQFYKMFQQYIQAKHTRKPFKFDQCEYAHALKSGLKKELHTFCNNKRKFVKNEALPRLLDANLQHAVLDQLL